MSKVFDTSKIKTFKLSTLVDRQLMIKDFIAMKGDNLIITTAIDLDNGEIFILDTSFPPKETKVDE